MVKAQAMRRKVKNYFSVIFFELSAKVKSLKALNVFIICITVCLQRDVIVSNRMCVCRATVNYCHAKFYYRVKTA